MDTSLIVALVIALVLIAVLVVLANSRRTARQGEEARFEAGQTRDLAKAATLESDVRAAEADESAARAEKERLTSEQQRMEADRQRTDADALHARADEIDPDVVVDDDIGADHDDDEIVVAEAGEVGRPGSEPSSP